MCVVAAARIFDSAAAGPTLRAVHAAMLQPAASPAAAAAACVRLGCGPTQPVTDPRRASAPAVVVVASQIQQCRHTARDQRHRTSQPEKSSKWPAEIRRRRCYRFIGIC